MIRNSRRYATLLHLNRSNILVLLLKLPFLYSHNLFYVFNNIFYILCFIYNIPGSSHYFILMGTCPSTVTPPIFPLIFTYHDIFFVGSALLNNSYKSISVLCYCTFIISSIQITNSGKHFLSSLLFTQ